MKLVNAQQARRILDRIVGYQGSQLLMEKSSARSQHGPCPIRGSESSFAIARKSGKHFARKSIGPLRPRSAGDNPPPFEAKLHCINGQDAVDRTGEHAQRIVNAVQGKDFVVHSIERKEKKRNPVAPFITSRLQQEAARKLHFTSKKTMTLAQQLYEGIEIGSEGPTGLITYMRTDSPRISQEAMEDAQTGDPGPVRRGLSCPRTPNVYKTQKAAQEAHEAIRPTSAGRDPESIRQYLERDHYQLYKLIWNRFIASQMVPAILEMTR